MNWLAVLEWLGIVSFGMAMFRGRRSALWAELLAMAAVAVLLERRLG